VTHMGTRANNEVRTKELKRIGYLIVLILTLLLTLPAYGAVIFSDGFETGNHSNWTNTTVSGTGLAEVLATNPYAGTYAGHYYRTSTGDVADQALAYKNFTAPAGNVVWAKGFFRFDSIPSSSYTTVNNVLSLNTTNLDQTKARFNAYSSTTLRCSYLNKDGTSYTSYWGTALSTGVYYALKISFDNSGANPVITWYVNGSQIATWTDTTTGTAYTPTQVRVGSILDTGITYADSYYTGTADTRVDNVGVYDSNPDVVLEQEGFRFRDDNGSESGATWLTYQDTDITRGKNTNTRLRVLLNTTDDPSSAQYQLEYKKSTDSTFVKVEPTNTTPLVESRSSGATTATDTTSHAITMPSGITAGDLLLIVFSSDGAVRDCSISSGGWVKLDEAQNGTTVTGAVFYKIAEGADTATVTTSTAEQSSHVVFRISGAGIPISASANGSSTNSNPPNLNTGISKNYLWIASRSGDSTVVATAAPTNYSNLQTQAAAGTSGASTNTAERSLAASSEDPGTFTSATEQWVSFTIAIPSSSIGVRTMGAAVVGTTSLTVPYPTGIRAGDLLVLAVANKYQPNTPSTPAGWTLPANGQGTGGSGTDTAADQGTVYATVFVKVATGSESGSQTVTINSGNSAVGRMLLVRGWGGATWDYAATNGSDNTPGTAWSVTGAADPGLTTGDLVLVVSAVNSDSFIYHTVALTASGITATGESDLFENGTTNGYDSDLVVSRHYILSGTATGAPTFTMTASGTLGTYNPAGASVFLRIRQIGPPIQLAASGNIASGGSTSTTFQLTAPSGKSTSDFEAGKISDDTNPLPAIDLGSDKYTELEWCLIATDAAQNGDVYQFRVTANGVPLNTYSVTPQWTIGVEGSFKYRRPITISDSMTPGSCTSDVPNFPVLVSLSGDWLKTRGSDPVNGRIETANGYDIVFRASDGRTPLDYEIERYDGTNGELIAWVRIPTLIYNGNTTIYMYYGNPKITSPTQNPTGVWSNGYVGVWHLKETAGGSGAIKNSTANAGLDGTDSGSPTFNATGQIDGAIGFDGTNDQIAITDPGTGSVLDFGTGASITLSAWIKPATLPTTSTFLIKGDTDGYNLNYGLQAGGAQLLFSYYGSAYNNYVTSANVLATGNWYHTALTYTFGTAASAILYVNGAPQAGTWTSGTGNQAPVQSNLQLWFGDDIVHERFNGIIDEVRISTVARDACWIGTEYNNQSAPGTFVTLGSEGAAAPTLVKLKTFTATQYDEGILLRWKTGYEVDNLGFHVYREENGQLVRLTPEPVAGSALMAGSRTALTAGHHYHWWDASLSPQSSSLGTVRYWLKDIDLNGTETMHGPTEIKTSVISDQLSVSKKFKPELLSEIGWRLQERYEHYWKVQELKQRLAHKPKAKVKVEVKGPSLRHGLRSGPTGLEGKGFHRKPDPAGIEVQRYLAGKSAVKIPVKEEGWYRVTQPELVAAGLSSKVNPKYLQLYADGQEQAIHIVGKRDGVFGPGDAIEFYGTGLDTPSTDTRVYWVVEGPRLGKRIYEVKGYSGSLSSSSFPHTVEVKDRWIYLPAIKNGEEENFFGAVVYGAGVDQLLNLQHLDPAPSEDAFLEVVLQGATNTSHRVKVLVNDEEVGEVAFEGQSRGVLQGEVPHSLLLEGDNVVSFIPQGGEMDVSLVDSIRLTYWHSYTADDNGLRLMAQGGNHLTVNGFSHPKIRVIDITDSGDVTEVIGKVESQQGGYAVNFRVPGHEQRTLLALTEEKVRSPEGVIPNQPSSWRESRDGYDFVIISHRDFLESLQPLKKLRESQGLKVGLIDIEDLYDEFSFGNKNPKAIKDFLASAKSNWRRSPRFVLLVGDASFDPKNYFGLGDFDFVPTKLVDTVYMETASDDWFVDLNNDGLPEMAIGRLPVQTADEAAIVVSKIIGYERSGKKNEALLVADRVDNSDDFNFEGASEEIWSLLPSSLTVRKIYRSQFSSDAQANGVLLGAINQGPLLVNFIGHGSIEIWRGNILTSDDAEGLINGMRLPFFVNMTCLNGYFQDPYSETLGEALIKAKGGGAIGVWTSSGLTEPDKQAVMNKELIKLLFGRESLTLGEATAKAKASVSDQDIRKTWILFGDPTTRLK
jgi:hypothetical protein